MATGKITKRVVDALIADAKRAGRTLIIWDAELTRFGVLATKTGAAAYVIQYRLGGRGAPSKRVTLGKHGALTPDEARKLASSQLGDVDRGRDVAQERQDARRKIAAGTFKEAVERYLAANGKNNKSWPETRRLLETDAVAALGSKPMATVSRGDVAALIDDVALRSHSVARALFAAIRPLFRWCRDRGIIDVNPILDLKGPAPLPSRERVLTVAEIQAFWRATDAVGWPFGPLYKLLLLTAQRREEVAAMTWREVDLKRATWALPAARVKNGKEHVIDLSPQAIAVLESLPGERRGLVHTTTGTSPVSGFSKVKARIDGLMAADLGGEFKPWRSHDLRRSASTLMAEELEIDAGVIERLLNHISGTQGGLQGVYQRQKYRLKRKAAMLAWGVYVERLTSGESASGDAPACSVAAGAAAH
jgi:integrase